MKTDLRCMAPAVAMALSLSMSGVVQAQCTNSSLYPGNAIVPDATGLVTTITTCSYQTEYSRITGIIGGANYQFAISDGTHITVHQGTFDGPVIGFGTSPLTVTAAGSGDLFAHWNTNATCGTATICLTTTVQLFLDCVPPTATYEVENVCEENVFFVHVEVTDGGDATSLDLTFTENNGPPTTFPGILVGSYQIGPFAEQSLVDITVTHADDSTCNVGFNDVTNPPCPVVSCGPDTYTHCYGNSEAYEQLLQGASAYPLVLTFASGAVSPSGNDALVIRDGLDASAPVLFSGVGNAGNLAGVSVISTNPDHALYLTMNSNSSFSCGDGGVSPPWTYTVACLDCESPAAQFELIPDCLHHTYDVAVNVTSLGTATEVRIANSWNTDTLDGVGLGTTILGPFPIGFSTTVSVLNNVNSYCVANSPALSYAPENCIVTACEPTDVEYCYQDDETVWFIYQSEVATPISIAFIAGQLLGADQILLYNGPDTSSQLVFAGNLGGDLSGLSLSSNNPQNALTLLVESDADASCAGGQASPALHWSIGCGLVGVEEGRRDLPLALPNPTTGILHINLPMEHTAGYLAEVLDGTGRTVLVRRSISTWNGQATLDLSTLAAGRYTVRITSRTGAWIEAVQVVR